MTAADLKTKFKLGDKLFFLDNVVSVSYGEVEEIKIRINKKTIFDTEGGVEITYWLENINSNGAAIQSFDESRLFKTKKELLKKIKSIK